MNSSKPYITRALHEWITDNKLTPYIAVDATVPNTAVPQEHVKDGQIILNISYDAVAVLNIANDRIEFDATFNQVRFQVYVPMAAIQAIYAQENGQGMAFEKEEETSPPSEPSPPPAPKKGKPSLKIVK